MHDDCLLKVTRLSSSCLLVRWSSGHATLSQVRFIGDQNPFRESSAGVQFFGVSTLNPELYTVQKGELRISPPHSLSLGVPNQNGVILTGVLKVYTYYCVSSGGRLGLILWLQNTLLLALCEGANLPSCGETCVLFPRVLALPMLV